MIFQDFHKNKKYAKIIEILLFIFLFLVIFSRVYLETAIFAKKPFFSYFVATHHCAWFTFVFFYFALCARYILGLKTDRIPYLALLSPVIYVPLIHAKIAETPLKLQYLRGDFSKIVFDIATFYWFSERDSQFFFEMIALLIAFIALSYFISRSVKRTVLNIVVGFYGSMFLAGIQFFGVAPRTMAVFKIHTVFKNHVFLSLVYFTAVILAFSICFAPEIKTLVKRDFKALGIALCAGFFSTIVMFDFLQKQLNIADLILLTVTCSTAVGSAVLLQKETNLPGGRFFPFVFSVFSLVLILGIIFKDRVFI
ncbi:hypothetical protein II898_00280 [bacterium]|nr:hypothetical protein [bacterium]